MSWGVWLISVSYYPDNRETGWLVVSGGVLQCCVVLYSGTVSVVQLVVSGGVGLERRRHLTLQSGRSSLTPSDQQFQCFLFFPVQVTELQVRILFFSLIVRRQAT